MWKRDMEEREYGFQGQACEALVVFEGGGPWESGIWKEREEEEERGWVVEEGGWKGVLWTALLEG